MNIEFPQYTYQALLAEANRQNKPLARLCKEILISAGNIYDNAPEDQIRTLPNKGNLGDLNEKSSTNRTNR